VPAYDGGWPGLPDTHWIRPAVPSSSSGPTAAVRFAEHGVFGEYVVERLMALSENPTMG